MTFWNDIFGQLNDTPVPASDARFLPPNLGPEYMEEAVGGSPTVREREGLEGSIVGTFWGSPVALAGYSPGAIDWFRATAPGTAGSYYPSGLRLPRNNPDTNTDETIRFRMGTPSVWEGPTGRNVQTTSLPVYAAGAGGAATRTLPTTWYGAAGGDPYFPEVGRHEFTHRGLYNLASLAREYQVPFDVNARPMAGPTFAAGERLVTLADRRAGFMDSYPEMEFTLEQERFYGAMLNHLESIADQINAARVQRMINTGGRWGDTP